MIVHPALPLPKPIRDELRMCCALRGYSKIREGDGMTIKQQHEKLSNFFHGIPGSSPSQIHMLTQGKIHYSDLFLTTTQRVVTSKSKGGSKRKTSSPKMYLKQTLSRDDSKTYYLGEEIKFRDLEKKIVLELRY